MQPTIVNLGTKCSPNELAALEGFVNSEFRDGKECIGMMAMVRNCSKINSKGKIKKKKKIDTKKK